MYPHHAWTAAPLVLLALPVPLTAQSAYLVDATQDVLFSVDLSSGSVTAVGSTSNNGLSTPADLCWRDASDEIWTVDLSGGEVGMLDRNTGQFTFVAPSPINGWQAMAWDHVDRVFWLHNQNDQLWSYEPTSGAFTLVGSIGTSSWLITAIEVDARGDLYGAVYQTGDLVRIDKATGVGTVVASTAVSSVQGLAIDDQGTWYAVSTNPDSLYTLDPGTGASVLIGPNYGTSTVKGMVITGTEFQRGGTGCPDGNGDLWMVEWSGSSSLGSTMQVGVGAQANATVGFQLFSFSVDEFEGTPLPLDAAAIGAPGCVLHVGNDFDFFITTGQSISLSVPADASFAGVPLFTQGVLADLGAAPNALGMVVSDYLRITMIP